MRVEVNIPGLDEVKERIDRHYDLLEKLQENLTEIEMLLGVINITEKTPPKRAVEKLEEE